MSTFFSTIAAGGTRKIVLPQVETVSKAVLPSDAAYSTWHIDKTTYERRSAFATVKFTTQSTSIDVSLYSENEVFELEYFALSVYDSNFNWVQDITPAISTELQTITLTLPSTGTYYIVESATTDKSGSFIGSSITNISGGDLTLDPITLNNDCVINFGDSISVGQGGTPPTKNGYHMLLRQNMPTVDFIAEGWGAERAYHHLATASKRTDFINRFKAEYDKRTGNKIYLFTAGTNDYGLNIRESFWNDTVLPHFDEVYAAIPDIKIIIFSPLVRANETNPNAYGLDLQWYRDSLQTYASSRAWLNYHEGKDVLTLPSDFTGDELHPNVQGHAKMATALQTIIETYIP
jgi:lysophospholipase L1-like esterase